MMIWFGFMCMMSDMEREPMVLVSSWSINRLNLGKKPFKRGRTLFFDGDLSSVATQPCTRLTGFIMVTSIYKALHAVSNINVHIFMTVILFN